MARISPSLVRAAAQRSPLLPWFLRATGSLDAAQRELGWVEAELPRSRWRAAARRRHALEPLQYILGSQPFGALTLECRRGVLVPRAETEAWVLAVCGVLRAAWTARTAPATVVDACTGSGCIALLAKHELQGLAEVSAFDVSSAAVALARDNAAAHGLDIEVYEADLAAPGAAADLVLANPPYIPEADYRRPPRLNGVERSVRRYEPRRALVGDTRFFAMLVDSVAARGARGFVFELGYLHQAQYVRSRLGGEWGCGLYRDLAGHPRCVVGWRRGSDLAALEGLCEALPSSRS
ncbi:peptide chain release factor N(5)-glutamine methyltransferase [[Candida] zeylanoides]